MNSLYASLSLILAEVILFLLVACGTLIFLKVKEQRKDKKALLALTEKIKESKEERLNVLSIKLKESHDLDSDVLNATAKKIRDTEIELYITMMNIYANRDSEALKKLDENIAAFTESNTKLGTLSIDNNTPAAGTTNNEEFNELKNEHARLQHELFTTQQINERLEKELDMAKKEMRETVAEFISAFNGGRDAAEEKLAQIEKVNEAKQATQQDEAPVLLNDTPIKKEELPLETDNALTSAERTDEPAVAAAEATTDESPLLTENDGAADNNPFLSIDENAIPNSDAESADSTIDRATDDSELDIDPQLNTGSSPTTPTQPPKDNAKTKTTDAPAVDDIDALLAANSDDTETVPTEVKSTDENFNPDDIDALLVTAITDSETAVDANKVTAEKGVAPDDIDALLATNTTTDEKTASLTTEEPLDVSADDIGAILEDIDLTTASALPSDNKEVEKAS